MFLVGSCSNQWIGRLLSMQTFKVPTSLHCTALYCTTLHFTTLHYSALQCSAVHCTALYCNVLLCTGILSLAMCSRVEYGTVKGQAMPLVQSKKLEQFRLGVE